MRNSEFIANLELEQQARKNEEAKLMNERKPLNLEQQETIELGDKDDSSTWSLL